MAIICTWLSLMVMQFHNAWAAPAAFPATDGMTPLHRSSPNRLPPSLPFVTHDAVVTGVASAGEQAVLAGTRQAAAWGGGARQLLHGNRRPSRYSVCPVCTLLSCNHETQSCSGHCKRTQKMFRCTSKGIPGGVCDDVYTPDPYSTSPSTPPIDTIGPIRSVSVAATAPFIGCANITDLPNGCPAPGTTGTTGGGKKYTVLESECDEHMYDLTCTAGANRTPFYPYGYCRCVVEFDDDSVEMVACRLSELKYLGPSPASSGGVPIKVLPDGNKTLTTFGSRDGLQLDVYKYNTTFDVGSDKVDVFMDIWYPPQVTEERVEADGPLASWLTYFQFGPDAFSPEPAPPAPKEDGEAE